MDATMVASAAAAFRIDPSASPVLRPPHLPWKLPPPHQNLKYYHKESYKCKRNLGWTLSLVKNCWDVSQRQDDTHPLPTFRMDISRRGILSLPATFLFASLVHDGLKEEKAMATEFADMPALRGKDYGKSKMRYPDFMETDSGLQYKDLRTGTGSTPKQGETVVVDWDGYTIGYYGRIFEARNKAKGGSFEGNDKVYFRFKLGTQEVIPAFEEAISTMSVGGVRRIIVPPDLGYPENDYNKKGPKPTTFSGQRALDFVLKNQGLIDKTLLFDIELLKIYSS